MFVPIDDHAELGPPVPDMIVRENLMSQESQHATQGVANHGAPQVPHMHRFGDVGRRKIDDIRARGSDPSDPQAFVLRQLGRLFGEACGFQFEINKPWPGNFGRFTQVCDIEFFEQRRRDVFGWSLRKFGEWHGAIGLEITKLAILSRFEHLNKRVGRVGHRDQSGSQS